jgi:hypothetical protein
MATIIVNPQNSSFHTRGIKRKRACVIKFNGSNVSADAISVQSRDEEYLSDANCSEGSNSEQSDTFMNDTSVSQKKSRAQEAPVRSNPASGSIKGGYTCPFEDCEKVYTKPTRLEEHKRSHTGAVCVQCRRQTP